MANNVIGDPIDILLIEDNPGDVRLTLEAFKEGKVRNNTEVVGNGIDALAFLRKEGKYKDVFRPDLILLDLNLPKMDGHEVLERIKTDPDLKRIPVVILTTSKDESDIIATYENHANCYISKPVELDDFLDVINRIEGFWLTVVKLPPNGDK